MTIQVSFLGMGVMGYPMAGHLAKNGFDLCIYNRTASRANSWCDQYIGRSASTPAQAVADSELIFMCLGRDDDVRSVVYGDDGIFTGIAPNALLIDHTTTSSKLAVELAKACRDQGVDWLDAPVSGGQIGAEEGTLTVMVGGAQQSLDRAREAINCYSQKIQHMGDVGKGQQAKMVNQICIAGLLQSLSEALQFALDNDIDTDALLTSLVKGAAQSWQMANRGTTMVEGKFDFGFSVKWMIKDLQICLEQAKQSQSSLPITELVLERYQRLERLGKGHLDTSSLITLLSKNN